MLVWINGIFPRHISLASCFTSAHTFLAFHLRLCSNPYFSLTSKKTRFLFVKCLYYWGQDFWSSFVFIHSVKIEFILPINNLNQKYLAGITYVIHIFLYSKSGWILFIKVLSNFKSTSLILFLKSFATHILCSVS